MNLEVVPLRPYHIELLRLQGLQASQLSLVPESYATLPTGPALTVFDGDRVIICGGICTVNGKFGVLWALLSQAAGSHMLWLHRATARFIDTQPVRRLESSVEKGFTPGCRWLKLLGFEYEGDMRAYGDGGQTHERWARIR